MLRAGYFLGRDSVEEMNASVPLVRVVAPPAPLLAAGDILDFGQALGADEDHIALARCQVAVALLRLALLAVLLDGLGDSPTGYENEGSSDNKGSTDSQVINCGVNLSSSFRALSEANSVFSCRQCRIWGAEIYANAVLEIIIRDSCRRLRSR